MCYTYEEEKVTIWKDKKDLLMLHNSEDDDLSALQPFQQLGTISIFILAGSSVVMSLCMNCLDEFC